MVNKTYETKCGYWKHYKEHIGCMYKYTKFVHMIDCTYETSKTFWECFRELDGNLMRTNWKLKNLKHPTTSPSLPSLNEKKLFPFRACWFTLCATKNFYAYLCFLPSFCCGLMARSWIKGTYLVNLFFIKCFHSNYMEHLLDS
jgi:hypothetical protein